MGFLKDTPELSERRSQTPGKERAIVIEQQVINWFDGLRTYLSNEEAMAILDNPTRMYNADKSGCPLATSGERVLAPLGASQVYQVSSSNRGQITILACIGAAGYGLTPMMIFPGKRFHYDSLECFPEAYLGWSDYGWMDSYLFYMWLKDHFLPHVTKKKIQKPVLLLVDGHPKHCSRSRSLHDCSYIQMCPRVRNCL